MKNIGATLGDIRKEKGFTRKDVAEKLSELGIDISDKTLYGYESGRTSANADMFLALCRIYEIDDIFTTFGYDGYNDDGSLRLTQEEIEIIEKHRALDMHGKKMVDFTLENEYQRSISNVIVSESEDDEEIDLGASAVIKPYDGPKKDIVNRILREDVEEEFERLNNELTLRGYLGNEDEDKKASKK